MKGKETSAPMTPPNVTVTAKLSRFAAGDWKNRSTAQASANRPFR